MAKKLVVLLVGLNTVLVIVLGLLITTLSRRTAALARLQEQTSGAPGETDLLQSRLELAEAEVRTLRQHAVTPPAEAQPIAESRHVPLPLPVGWEPQITTNSNGSFTYFFAELYGPNSEVVAHAARFRELLNNTKLSFRTSTGIRYFDLDELHPDLVRSIGYDPGLLKNRAARELQNAQLRSAQALFQQQLRNKAAAESAQIQKNENPPFDSQGPVSPASAQSAVAAPTVANVTRPMFIGKTPIVVYNGSSQILGGSGGNSSAGPISSGAIVTGGRISLGAGGNGGGSIFSGTPAEVTAHQAAVRAKYSTLPRFRKNQ